MLLFGRSTSIYCKLGSFTVYFSFLYLTVLKVITVFTVAAAPGSIVRVQNRVIITACKSLYKRKQWKVTKNSYLSSIVKPNFGGLVLDLSISTVGA